MLHLIAFCYSSLGYATFYIFYYVMSYYKHWDNKALSEQIVCLLQLLDVDAQDDAEEGANIDLDSQRKGKCAVIKTSTRQVSCWPVSYGSRWIAGISAVSVESCVVDVFPACYWSGRSREAEPRRSCRRQQGFLPDTGGAASRVSDSTIVSVTLR
mgnify:CR=1 FL=1